MPKKTLPVNINGHAYEVEPGQSILDVLRSLKLEMPTLCHLEGLTPVGACRLCLVEIEGSPRLFPACTTPVAAHQRIRTDTEKLRRYRRITVELLFSERNHVCSVCVANNHCELQKAGYDVGMDHVRFAYQFPEMTVDASHKLFIMDHNRCILCTRCVRACREVEGAYTWDVQGRGIGSNLISDLNQPWGESDTCTSCGKCVEVCPTGALWHKDEAQGQLGKNPGVVKRLVSNRKAKL